jgi:hypothetical protein
MLIHLYYIVILVERAVSLGVVRSVHLPAYSRPSYRPAPNFNRVSYVSYVHIPQCTLRPRTLP